MDKNAESILDVGCAKGEPMRFINRKKQFYTVGVDIFEPYIREAMRDPAHDTYVLSDARKLPFKKGSFDVVICMEVLEHLERNEGNALLQALAEIARKQVILSTPVGAHKQDSFDGNPHQEHKYVWSPQEMRQLGYQVRGGGIRGLGGKSGIQSPLPRLLHPLVNIIWVSSGPLTYFLPSLAGDMVCHKKLRGNDQPHEQC